MAQLAVYLGKVALHPGISGHRIRRLNLRACMLGDAGAIKLAGALPSVPTLQVQARKCIRHHLIVYPCTADPCAIICLLQYQHKGNRNAISFVNC